MKKILLASHGNLAKGMKDTLKIFIGSIDSITDVCAYNEPGDKHLNEIKEFIEMAEENESIIFTDILGGSVNQQVTKLVIESKKKIPIISSMNLPIVLALALSDESIDDELVSVLSKESMPQLVPIDIGKDDTEDIDDFFD